MATCYLCGRAGADFRRTVETGRSHGYYYGKRSTSYSTRTYTGLRTVCEDCAFDIDKGRLMASIAGRWIIAIILTILIVYYKF